MAWHGSNQPGIGVIDHPCDAFPPTNFIEHRAPVFMGATESVGLRVEQDVAIGLHRRARRDLTVHIVYDDPVPAPLAQGDVVASLVIEAPGTPTREVPLVAAEDVGKKGLLGRVGAALAHMIRG